MSKMTQHIRVLTAKPNDLYSVSRTYSEMRTNS